MQPSPFPIVQDLVLIGGGHTHVGVLKSLGMKPVPGQRVTLICRDILTPYSGMLPGYISGHYTHAECHIDLGPLAAFAGARFIHDEVTGLDPAARTLTLRNRPPLSFDIASVNIGSAPVLKDVAGAAQFTTPVKPISRFTARWKTLLDRVKAGSKGLRIGVVGAGAGGVELILSVQYRLERELRDAGRKPEQMSYHLFQGGGEILPTLPRRVRAKFAGLLSGREIRTHLNCRIKEARKGSLVSENGQEFPLDEVLWTTRAGAQAWLRETGLAVDGKGFVLVDDTLRSTSHPHVFAAGDIAHVINHPREKAGVFAVRQGPPLDRNIRRAARGAPVIAFKPQKTFLTLISTGNKSAVGCKGPAMIAGDWVWRWKDRIDRKFMTNFQQLPEMPVIRVPADAAKGAGSIFEPMPCGGCGAKIGADVLCAALHGLSQPRRDDVLTGLDAPDDAAILSVPEGMVQVQSIDHFRSFINDPRLFSEIAMVHALGDIWAMGAQPQAALAMVTLPPMSPAKQRDILSEILEAACSVLNRHGAVLVGGHTGEGKELALGFSVTGLARPADIRRKSGLRAGQVLLLTKPLGTGVLMAAGMQGKAAGPWTEAVLNFMLQDNANTASILVKHGATALTDVTGFGLIGHLGEMLTSSGVSAEIEAGAIPYLPGAQVLSDGGITSTFQPENLKQSPLLTGDATAGEKYPLLFDPQTSGGLLAGIPRGSAGDCLQDLRDAGCREAAVIGTVRNSEHPLINIR